MKNLPKKKLPVKKVPAVKPKAAAAKKLPPPKKPAVAVGLKPKAAKPPAAKKEAKPARTPVDPSLDYRKLRKYTVPMLDGIIKELGAEAGLKDLMRRLRKLEAAKRDWKGERSGGPKKRGRPSKADIAAREKAAKLAKLKPVADAAAVFARAKAGGLVPPRKAPPAPPPKAPQAPAKKVVLNLKKRLKAA
jgi:hypothetical protein